VTGTAQAAVYYETGCSYTHLYWLSRILSTDQNLLRRGFLRLR
jgi:hypothetical protein